MNVVMTTASALKMKDFDVNLTCPVPHSEKRLKETCISFERSKYSKCVEMLVIVLVQICYVANRYIGLGILVSYLLLFIIYLLS